MNAKDNDTLQFSINSMNKNVNSRYKSSIDQNYETKPFRNKMIKTVFNYENSKLKAAYDKSSSNKFSDSDLEEYSFDEKEFLNVDENPSRNISSTVKESFTYQPSMSAVSSIYNNIGTPSIPGHHVPYKNDKNLVKKPIIQKSSMKKLENNDDLGNDKGDFEQLPNYHQEESFDNESEDEEMDVDLDEGYAFQNGAFVPEKTPELGIKLKDSTAKKTPSKRDSNIDIKQKLDLSAFQTHDLRIDTNKNSGKLLSVKNPTYMSHNKTKTKNSHGK